MTRHGIFTFENPPTDEALQQCLDALDSCDYPFERCLPELRRESDSLVRVTWEEDGPQGASGWYRGWNVNRIVLSRRYTYTEFGFVFLHEAGHMVDDTVLTRDQRAALLAKWHTDLDGPYDGRTDPNDHSDDPGPFAWSHDTEHDEGWRTRNDYLLRPNESFADAFVAAFAPTIFPNVRFAHWSDDIVGIRQLILERAMTYSDVNPDGVHTENINRASDLGLVNGYSDGTFKPSEPITREAVATMLVHLYDLLKNA